MLTEYPDDSRKFQLCEEFADLHELPADYVWQEFVDPNTATLQEVTEVLIADIFDTVIAKIGFTW
jgi:hypothetical protein